MLTKNGTKQKKMKSGWGGKREGAGRPNLTNTLNHARRVRVSPKTPLLVTHQLNPGFPTLRRRESLEFFRIAAQRAQKHGLRILHYNLLRDQLILIVEAKDNRTLGLGMRSLTGTLAKALNRENGGGKVFRDRYHLSILTDAKMMKDALELVLVRPMKSARSLDQFTSGAYFRQWKNLVGHKVKTAIPEDISEATKELTEAGLAAARSKLARDGWVRAK